MQSVLVTGAAGYVGSVLVPSLIAKGYPVTAFDTFWFWDSPDDYARTCGMLGNTNLRLVKGDLRHITDIRNALHGCDTVIHLACISNDPSSELNPDVTHAINYTGSVNLIDEARAHGVKRFIYASSSSVYGIKKEPQVTEELPLEPLTQYSRLKVEIEHYLLHRLDSSFHGVVLRPSTVCGYSPRQRFDVIVNILTHSALIKKKIIVLGGDQLRPNIHMKDMVRAYELLLEAPLDKINGKIYNVGDENKTVLQIAEMVREVVGDVEMEITPTNDPRSYHVCSDRIRNELGFELKHSIKEAIIELKDAILSGKIKNANDDRWFNVKMMKNLAQH